MMDFIRKLACRICHSGDKPKPELPLFFKDAQAIRNELQALGLTSLYPGLMDASYFYATGEDWARALSYILFEFERPKWVAERFDCDDAAFLLHSLFASFFGLNTCAVAFGTIPSGYHSWNLLRTDVGWLQFEPQTGEIFELGDPLKQYKPEVVLL